MKKLIKRPLKITAAAMFMVAMCYGVSTNSAVSESGKTGNVNLSALSSVSAQGRKTTHVVRVNGMCMMTGMAL